MSDEETLLALAEAVLPSAYAPMTEAPAGELTAQMIRQAMDDIWNAGNPGVFPVLPEELCCEPWPGAFPWLHEPREGAGGTP